MAGLLPQPFLVECQCCESAPSLILEQREGDSKMEIQFGEDSFVSPLAKKQELLNRESG
jgi:hypothetical protein